MKISDDVMNDLLTMYLAGDASADTKALVEAHARDDRAFAARLAAAATLSLPDMAPGRSKYDLELRALTETRQFIRLRTIFCAGGILFTALPLAFTFGHAGVEFLILGRHPGLVWGFWSVAAAAWVSFVVISRRVGRVGLV
jgi:anti-sigma factor RsiW